MNDLISIIVPVYNEGKYFDRCIKSIINQIYKNIEIIIINDGSKEKYRHKYEEISSFDNRIILINKENGGQSSARNVGLDVAKGKFIAFVDSDDYLELDYISYLYNLIKKYSADVVYCDYIYTNGQKKIKQSFERIHIKSKEELYKYFLRINGEKSSYAVWRGLYNKDYLNNIRFREGIIYEDFLFTYNVYKKSGLIVFSNQIKYNYFINKEGITLSALSKKDFVILDIWKYIINDIDEKYKNYALLNLKRTYFTLYVKYLISGKNKEVDNEHINILKENILLNYKDLIKSNILDLKRKLLLRLLSIKFRFLG